MGSPDYVMGVMAGVDDSGPALTGRRSQEKAILGASGPIDTALTNADYKSVMKVCLQPATRCSDETPVQEAARDRALRDGSILALGYAAGLSAPEVSALKVSDYDGRRGALSISWGAFRARKVPLSGSPRVLLELWLATHAGTWSALYYGFSSRGRPATDSISDRTVRGIAKRYTRASRMKPAVGFGAFRQAFRAELESRGLPPRSVASVLGTASRSAGLSVRDVAVRDKALAEIAAGCTLGIIINQQAL